MAIGIGSILKLIGGKPHMKVGSVIAEKLPITKMLDGGGLGNLLNQMLTGGPEALLKNPVGQLASQLKGQLDGFASQIQNALGGGGAGLVQALTGSGGLGGALDAIQSVTNNLSGLTSTPGQYGRLDVFTHAQATEAYGTALPSSLSLTSALAPMREEDRLAALNQTLPGMINSVLNGQMSADDAATVINGHTNSLNASIATSNAAFATVEAQSMMIAAIHATAAFTATVTHPAAVPLAPELSEFITQTTKADALLAMQAAVAQHLDSPVPEAVEEPLPCP
jgi:hypothetical protein